MRSTINKRAVPYRPGGRHGRHQRLPRAPAPFIRLPRPTLNACLTSTGIACVLFAVFTAAVATSAVAAVPATPPSRRCRRAAVLGGDGTTRQPAKCSPSSSPPPLPLTRCSSAAPLTWQWATRRRVSADRHALFVGARRSTVGRHVVCGQQCARNENFGCGGAAGRCLRRCAAWLRGGGWDGRRVGQCFPNGLVF